MKKKLEISDFSASLFWDVDKTQLKILDVIHSNSRTPHIGIIKKIDG